MSLEGVTAVYLDGGAWVRLADWAARRSLKWLRGPRYLLSQAVLDEFASLGTGPAREVAEFAWRVAEHEPLLEGAELLAAEIRAAQRGRTATCTDAAAAAFLPTWDMLRAGFSDPLLAEAVRARVADAQSDRTRIVALATELLAQDSSARVSARAPQDATLSRDAAARLLSEALEHGGQLSRVPEPGAIAKLDFELLPATDAWLAYHVALARTSETDGAARTNPTRNSVDTRHAPYAGLCDVLVTADGRLAELLAPAVQERGSAVLSPEAFTELVTA